MKDFFKGIKIIELSSVLAGPYASMLFSELGAEVIKVENINGGDVTRSWKLKTENENSPISAYYASVNHNKKVLPLDLTKMAHINKLYEEIKTADILISNFKKGDEYKFALDYGRVKVINPRLIYAHLKGFEFEETRVAYDVVIQAETGFMKMNGYPDSPPAKIPVALMDVLAGHQIRSAILSALWKREKTKRGCQIDVFLNKSAIAALVNQGSNYLMEDLIPKRIGSRHPNIALYGEIFNCKDGEDIVLAIGTDKHFALLCNALGNSTIAHREEYSSNINRLKHIDTLTTELSDLFNKQDVSYWIQSFSKLNIPYGKLNSMKDVAASKQGLNMTISSEIEGVPSKRFSTVAFEIKTN